MNHRHKKALDILKRYNQNEYLFLGEGMSSVVFRTAESVYKVFLLENIEGLSYKKQMLSVLQTKSHLFDNSNFFFPIQDLINLNENEIILIYPYEKSEPCYNFHFDEIQEFLTECWRKRIVFQDIKPDNFIRVIGQLKWIDYEPDIFTDNLFLNMAVRAFIYCKFPNAEKSFLLKLCRSAINQFDLLELEGFQKFANRLFAKIIYQESALNITQLNLNVDINCTTILDFLEFPKSFDEFCFSLPYQDDVNPEKLFFELLNRGIYLEHLFFNGIYLDNKNYFSPEKIYLKVKKLSPPKHKVTLIIKACIQDSEVLYESVKHIVRQIASPNVFDEKILALDIRQSEFLREYNSEGTWLFLLSQAQRLIDEKIIDKFIFPDENDILLVNRKWFFLETNCSHTHNKIPVTSQLFAFDQARNNFVLQIDLDVIIGRRKQTHSFLGDMIDEFEKNENVVSVGFNIYKDGSDKFTPYFGFENGGFVPEVRFCLLNRERLEKLLPLPNAISENGLKLSWYRALEQRQKETITCSIRGGNSNSFFIHPPNFKKADKDTWFTVVDRVEQLSIPENQINQFDLIGSYYDWTSPKRNENLVVISCFRNISLSRFLRFWYSLISQSYTDWGLILVDDASENGVSYFIKEIIKSQKEKVTFIQNKFRVGIAQNTYKAIHYFVQNQDSIITILDGDDALIGKNALKNVYEKYTFGKADVVIGKMYRTDKIHAHYKYTPNFIDPRLYGGNIWQHLRSFKKYLFDSLGFEDLKNQKEIYTTEDVLLSKRFNQKMVFPEHCWDYTYMVPIVEMSVNPMCINHFNVFHDRTTVNTPEIKQQKDAEIDKILAKPRKSPKDAIIGRKTFIPNLKQIEIDITYDCNLKCINCNRSCTQAPTKDGMSLDQIIEFIRDSIKLKRKWRLINLLGGEPTIHIDFVVMVNEILNKYIIPFSPQTVLQITTNGYGSFVKEKLSQLPNHPQILIDEASFKDGNVTSYFSPFNDAPIDNISLRHDEYNKGCWVTSYCGIGLNHLGYYPCGVAGGIDRVFELNLGVKRLADVDESISKLLDSFCRYCGNFTDYSNNFGNFIPRNEKSSLTKMVLSESWKTQYEKHNGK
jgi:hypothetical protein